MTSVSTRKSQTKSISFTGGIDEYKANDDLKLTELRAGYDARMVKIGRYKTRKGLDRFSVPIGETANSTVGTAGATSATLSGSIVYAQKHTNTAAGCITKVDVHMQSLASRSGTVLVELYTDASDTPGTLLARSSFKTSDIPTSSADYVSTYFLAAPTVTAGQAVWLVIKLQSATLAQFALSTDTSLTTAMLSNNGGTSWTAQAYGIVSKLYVSLASPVLGMISVNRPNGSTYRFFAAKASAGTTSVYSVNESTGVTTEIKSGMSSGATKFRFYVIQDALYWVNGQEKPWKYDFSAVTSISACPINPDLIIEHAGLMFVAREDDTKMYWSNFGVYDTWTSTDFAYMLAPKTPFTMSALAKLNGVLYTFAKRNKFQLLGEDNASFSASEAMDQRGTFSQESVVWDDNTIYHASDDGIWAFNGSDSMNLAKTFLNTYMEIPDKSSIVLEKWGNRLYVYYTSAGASANDRCYVINLTLGLLESVDLTTPIGRAYARMDSTNYFLVGSNKVAALYRQEAPFNDHSNLGDQLQFDLWTSASTFDAPGHRKQLSKWRPEFASAGGSWGIECGYALDNSPYFNFTEVALNGNSLTWESGWLWDDGSRYATGGNVSPTTLLVPGSFKRLQRRYRHIAAREPVEFDNEVLEIETQRLI